MGNSFESWDIISKVLAKVMGIMGYFSENFVDTLIFSTLELYIYWIINKRVMQPSFLLTLVQDL